LTPSKTLQIAQSLYLAGLISYPRTSSQKLPASIGYKEILKKLAKEYDVEKLITKNKLELDLDNFEFTVKVNDRSYVLQMRDSTPALVPYTNHKDSLVKYVGGEKNEMY